MDGGESVRGHTVDSLELERRLSHVEDRAAANTRRLNKMEQAQSHITELVRSVSSIAQKQTDMDADMKEIKADVKALNGRPAKRWDSVVEKALLTVVAALVGWCLVRLGIG